MKATLLAATLWLLASLPLAAQTDVTETPLTSKIVDVRVYQNRAGIGQEGAITLQPGDYLLVFSGLSQYIQPKSIQVSGTGAGVIQSVTHRISYLNRTPKTRRMVQIEDSLKLVQLKTEELNEQIVDLKTELSMILENKNLGGTNTHLTADELAKLSAFYATRIPAISKAKLALQREVNLLTESQNRLRSELNSINNGRNQPTQEVVVAYQAKSAGRVALRLAYLVDGTGWTALYDLRATSKRDVPIALSLKANVINTTGVDWKGVKLTLSTANPTTGGTPPEVPTQYVDVYQPQTYGYAAGAPAMASRSMARDDEAEADSYGGDEMAEEGPAAEKAAEYTQTAVYALSVEYAISLPYDVPADGKPRLVDIRDYQLPATYAHYAAPKYDTDAFLRGSITGWDQYNLLPGTANVYFDGTFLTETYLDPTLTRDTLRIGLGRDMGVVIKREQVQDFTSRKAIGSNIRETRGYKIEVRNAKAEAVTITVEDQIPVSQNNEIVVALAEGSGAAYSIYNGRLTWTFTLKPGESRTLSFNYEVKYPKAMQVQGL